MRGFRTAPPSRSCSRPARRPPSGQTATFRPDGRRVDLYNGTTDPRLQTKASGDLAATHPTARNPMSASGAPRPRARVEDRSTEDLVASLLPLAKRLAARYRHAGESQEDLEQ